MRKESFSASPGMVHIPDPGITLHEAFLAAVANEAHESVITAYLTHYPDISVIDADHTIFEGKSALEVACNTLNEELVRVLLKLRGDQIPKLFLSRRLLKVCEGSGGDPSAVVRALLDAGAEMNHTDVRRSSVLHGAAAAGHAKTVAILCEAGASGATQDFRGVSPLMNAAFYKHYDCVKEFLKDPSNLRCVNIFNNTALHAASSRGDYELVKLLLNAGMDPRVADMDGLTALDVCGELTSLDRTVVGRDLQQEQRTIVMLAKANRWWEIRAICMARKRLMTPAEPVDDAEGTAAAAAMEGALSPAMEGSISKGMALTDSTVSMTAISVVEVPGEKEQKAILEKVVVMEDAKLFLFILSFL